jgi:hypothetical protein
MNARITTLTLLSFLPSMPQNVPVGIDPSGGVSGAGVGVRRQIPAPGQQQSPQQQSQSPQPAKQEPPGHMEGSVVNAVSGEPLKRANVMLMPAEGRPDSNTYTGSTDASGRFSIPNIVPGTYRLWAERNGYVRTSYGARGFSRMGSTISVMPGQEVKQIEFRLPPHAVIAGRITDEEGEPLANVQVQPMMFRFMQGKRQLMPAGGASTNDLGEYRIFGLAAGRYYLSATIRPQGMGFIGTAPARPNQPEDGFATTYYPGTLDLRTAGQLQVHAGRPLTGMDMRLTRVKTTRIRGRVLNVSAGGMNRPMLMLLPKDSGFMALGRNMAPVRADNTFELSGVTPGSYYVMAQSMENGVRTSGRVAIDVGNADVEGIEVPIAAGETLTVSVRFEGEAPAAPSAFTLMLEPKEMTPFGGTAPAVKKDDGTFTFGNVTPDTYRLRVYSPQNQFYIKTIYAGQEEARDGEFTISAGAPPALSVTLSSAGGQIAGTVKGETNAPPPGTTVVLIPSNRQRADLYRSATIDQYGKFTLASIAPGEYKLFAWDDVESGQWMDPDFLQTYDSKGKSISIRDNSKEAAELQILKNDGSMAGTAP